MSEIRCGVCGSHAWCVWETDDWICKECFLAHNHNYEEWETLVQEAKERRRQKLEAAALGVEPIQYFGKTRQKPRKCNFCQMLIYWDDNLEGSNKFVETESKLPHGRVRCEAIQHGQKQKGILENA